MADDGPVSGIKSDEVVELFPTYAYQRQGTGEWYCGVHAQIYEPEEDSKLRRLAIGAFRRGLRLEKDAEESELFIRRARRFLVDNERRKRVVVQIGSVPKRFELRPSLGSGHVRETIRLGSGVTEGVLDVKVVMPEGDERSFASNIHAIGAVGVSVVSDIDDTTKDSDVLDKKELMKNTFLREYRAVEGMSALYSSLREKGTQFHYVSNSPWQLYSEIQAFADKSGFPQGTYHLRVFRAKDSSLIEFLTAKENHKRTTIAELIERFPRRKFILIGDTGERDPEVYGDLYRRYPGRVALILLRDVHGKGEIDERLREAMWRIPPNGWRVFVKPGDVNDAAMRVSAAR